MAILVCRASLIDQFFALHPDGLWTAPVEEARIDPDNLYIMGHHLLCAAFEQPLSETEPRRVRARQRHRPADPRRRGGMCGGRAASGSTSGRRTRRVGQPPVGGQQGV
ncbi:MAG: hypothetical protein M5U09_19260 [Gammaproteobacteria bacterium]|nr:hypothetical protein [Gammaproteobacteria bacterium]